MKNLAVFLFFLAACGSDDPAPVSTAVGGAALGVADAHCGTRAQTTSPYACGAPIGTRTVHIQHDPDGGIVAYLATMFGTTGADDDCKYDVAWTSTPIRENTDVSVDWTVTTRTTHTAAAGASANVELYLDDTHTAPNSGATTTEIAPGVYHIGPLRFDRPGRWTMRLHVFDNCLDETPDSPHGHAAFYVDVP